MIYGDEQLDFALRRFIIAAGVAGVRKRRVPASIHPAMARQTCESEALLDNYATRDRSGVEMMRAWLLSAAVRLLIHD
jgi:hypothetical protein